MKLTVIRYSIRAIMIIGCSLIITSCTKNNNVKSDTAMKKETAKQFVFSTEHLKRYKFPTHINDIIIDRVQSSFSEVFMVVIEPDKAPPFHKHDDTEQVFYVVEGTGVLTIGDKKEQYNVKPGDVVGVRERSKSLEIVNESLRSARYNRTSWLEWDKENLVGKFLNVPERSDIPENIKEQLIVELYSK